VKANRGAAGVDGESLAAFEKDLKGNCACQSRSLHRHRTSGIGREGAEVTWLRRPFDSPW